MVVKILRVITKQFINVLTSINSIILARRKAFHSFRVRSKVQLIVVGSERSILLSFLELLNVDLQLVFLEVIRIGVNGLISKLFDILGFAFSKV